VEDCFGNDIHETIPAPSGFGRVIKDEEVKHKWLKFHREHADLQITHASCNLKKGSAIFLA
jgi:hypothetical protein